MHDFFCGNMMVGSAKGALKIEGRRDLDGCQFTCDFDVNGNGNSQQNLVSGQNDQIQFSRQGTGVNYNTNFGTGGKTWNNAFGGQDSGQNKWNNGADQNWNIQPVPKSNSGRNFFGSYNNGGWNTGQAYGTHGASWNSYHQGNGFSEPIREFVNVILFIKLYLCKIYVIASCTKLYMIRL